MVYIEDVMISDFSQRGISDERTVDGRLNVINTILRNNADAGITVAPGNGAVSARIDVAMDRVTSEGNLYGMVFNNGARVMINDSTSSNNASAGVASTSTIGSTTVNINRSMVSNNGGAAMLTSGTSLLRFSDTDIAFNATGFSGATLTFGTSRITGNLVIGTVPDPHGRQLRRRADLTRVYRAVAPSFRREPPRPRHAPRVIAIEEPSESRPSRQPHGAVQIRVPPTRHKAARAMRARERAGSRGSRRPA